MEYKINIAEFLSTTLLLIFLQSISIAQESQIDGELHIQSDVAQQVSIKNSGPGGLTWLLSSSQDGWNAGGGKFLINNSSNTANSTFIITNDRKVGIGQINPLSKLSVNGKINVGNDAFGNQEGDIRYNSLEKDFEGYNGTLWKSLTEAATPFQIDNLDENTFVRVQESSSSDYIRIDLDGDERLRLVDNSNNIPRLEFYNEGNNISLGDDAGLAQKSTGIENVAIGNRALESNAIGDHNVAVGTEALSSINFDNSSTGIPFGSQHVGIGYQALSESTGTTVGNTALGYQAGQNTQADYSLFIGHSAGKEGGSGVFIGYNAGVNTTLSKTDALFIANRSGNRPLLYGLFENNYLRTNGTFDILSEGDGLVNNTDKDLVASFRSTSEHPTILFSAGGSSLFDGMSIEYDGSSTTSLKRMHINDRDADPIVTVVEGNSTTSAKVGINNTNPTGVLHVEGDAYITGIPTPGGFASDLHVTSTGKIIKASSDERLKKDIRTIEDPLRKVLQLRGTSFEWKAGPNPNRTLGVIAQEVFEVVPDIVNTDGEFFGVNYSEIPALLIEAIKEQNSIISSQAQLLKKQSTQLSDLSARLAAIENSGVN